MSGGGHQFLLGRGTSFGQGWARVEQAHLLLAIYRAYGGGGDSFGAADFCTGPLRALT